MFDASLQEKAKGTNSVTAPLRSILERLRANPAGTLITEDDTREVLAQLGGCKFKENALDHFTIDLDNIVRSLQTEEIESLVKARYGQEAYRIFRLLGDKGALETDVISAKTIVDKKVVNETLGKLWKDNYIDLQNLEKTSTVCVWQFKKNVSDRISDNLYHAALNLCQKISQLDEQSKQVSEDSRKNLIVSKFILRDSLLKLVDALLLFQT